MNRTRYREERTITRGMRRLPGEERKSFKAKVITLRRNFEQFNTDVSEICQWLMSIRPNGKHNIPNTEPFWDFILEPHNFVVNQEETNIDSVRLVVFEMAVGWRQVTDVANFELERQLLMSLESIQSVPRTIAAKRMLQRIKNYEFQHKMVLLRSAVEWINTRFIRTYKNWEMNIKEFLEKKKVWENDHPKLTEEIRNTFNKVFDELEISKKNPNICRWSHLKKNRDNCNYAGVRIKVGGEYNNHSEKCKRYQDFLKKHSAHKKYFAANAMMYINIRKKRRDLTKREAIKVLLDKIPQARSWFPQAWDNYLEYLGLNEISLINKFDGQLPHCLRLDTECIYNVHTQSCRKYYVLLKDLPDKYLSLEETYREWRKYFLREPRKPVFAYPSTRQRTVSKIFGRDYFEADYDNSIIKLRLDDMAEGQFLSFGFKPWPVDYDVQPIDTEITSVLVHFIGTRARVGFRFKMPHRPSRINIKQDELDELRSRSRLIQEKDQALLEKVRLRLRDGFIGIFDKELRVLAVDLGTSSCATAFFVGRQFQESSRLQIVKYDRVYKSNYEIKKRRNNKGIDKQKQLLFKEKGLNQYHIKVHLDKLAEQNKQIIKKREASGNPTPTEQDMRRLSLHIGWMHRDWVRINASQIIKSAKKLRADLIVFESLRDFRPMMFNEFDIDKKRRLAFFPFGLIRHKVIEKAVESGMRVVTVPYMFSSQFCGACGRQQNDKKRLQKNKTDKRGACFICEYNDCAFEGDPDENAARVLGGVFWGNIRLPLS